MSPTVFYREGFRFYFFSREESRMHVHVYHAEGEAKYWLTPQIELARHNKLSGKQLNRVETIIEEHYDEIVKAWHRHFDH